MKLGHAAILVVALGGLAGSGLGCSREARPPAQPSEPPPLPPTSGTPIGHLIDDARELKLSDDQLRRLEEISGELAGQLDGDDTGLHPDPVPPSKREEKGRGLGFHVGGARADDGTRGGAQAYPGIGGDSAREGASGRSTVITSDTATDVYRQRARHVRDAIRRALALLDAGQQAIARRVLTEHGVNLDTGEVTELDGTKLEEPKPGQPRPREN